MKFNKFRAVLYGCEDRDDIWLRIYDLDDIQKDSKLYKAFKKDAIEIFGKSRWHEIVAEKECEK